MQLKGYVKDNRLLGVDEESRGYSSFLFNRNNTNDHCVVGQAEIFTQIRILLFTILVLVAISIAIVFPAMILNYYRKLQSMIVKGTNRSFNLWATIVLMVLVEPALIGHGIWAMYDGVQSKLAFVDVWWYYAFCIGTVPLLPLVNFIITITIGLVRKKYNIITTNPIPCPVLCCNRKRCAIYIVHCAMISVIVTAVQLILIIHGYFIVLALIAAPIYTISLLLFCIAIFYFSVAYITSLLKALSNCKKSLHGSFVCCIGFIFLTVLYLIFAAVFVKITMLGGEYHSSGGILLSMMKSLVSVIVLTLVGKLGQIVLTRIDQGQSQESPVPERATVSLYFSSDNISIIRDQRVALANVRKRDTREIW